MWGPDINNVCRSWTLYRAFGGRSARLWTYFAKNYMWTVLNKCYSKSFFVDFVQALRISRICIESIFRFVILQEFTNVQVIIFELDFCASSISVSSSTDLVAVIF